MKVWGDGMLCSSNNITGLPGVAGARGHCGPACSPDTFNRRKHRRKNKKKKKKKKVEI